MSEPPLLRIRDWQARFENNRTKELRKMTWMPEPTDLSSDTYLAIVDHPDGPAHLGATLAIHMVAAKGVPRGYLRREDGRPHDAESIARVTRMPLNVVQGAIERLLQIGELETGKAKPRPRKRITSQLPAVIPQHPAGKPALQSITGQSITEKWMSSSSDHSGSLKEQPEPAEPPTTTLTEFFDQLAGWYDQDILAQIFKASEKAAGEPLQPFEVAEMLQSKFFEYKRLHDGKQPGGGFLLASVPKMFAGKNAQYLQRRKGT